MFTEYVFTKLCGFKRTRRQIAESATRDISGAGFSVYSGREVEGWPVMTLRRGEVVYEIGEIRAGPGSGELLRRGRWQTP